MELQRAMAKRRMVRSFAATPIERSRLDRLLDRSRRGPSAGNTSAVSFVVLDEPTLTTAYWDLTLPEPKRSSFRWTQLLDAPAIVLVLTRPLSYVERYAERDKGRAGLGDDLDGWPVPFWWVDAGAVVQNLLLSVVDDGLGACLFGVFDHEEAVKERFRIGADERIVAAIAVGEPLPDEPGRSAGRPRPPLNEVIRRPGPAV